MIIARSSLCTLIRFCANPKNQVPLFVRSTAQELEFFTDKALYPEHEYVRVTFATDDDLF